MKPYNSFAVSYVPGTKSPCFNNSPYKEVIVESVNEEEDINIVSVTFVDSTTEKCPKSSFQKKDEINSGNQSSVIFSSEKKKPNEIAS